MSAASKTLAGWHSTRGAVSFVHRWHTKELADGQNWVEADCAVGIVIHGSNLEPAKPGNAVCVQCREAIIVAMHDDLIEVARAVAQAGKLVDHRVPPRICDIADKIMSYLPPPDVGGGA